MGFCFPQRHGKVPGCGVGSVTSMVITLNDAIAAVSQDTAQIQQAYQQLRRALADLTAMVKEYGASPAATRPYGPPTPVMSTPYPEVRNDDRGPSSITGRPSSPETIEFGPEIITVNRLAADHLHRPGTSGIPSGGTNPAIQQQVA